MTPIPPQIRMSYMEFPLRLHNPWWSSNAVFDHDEDKFSPFIHNEGHNRWTGFINDSTYRAGWLWSPNILNLPNPLTKSVSSDLCSHPVYIFTHPAPCQSWWGRPWPQPTRWTWRRRRRCKRCSPLCHRSGRLAKTWVIFPENGSEKWGISVTYTHSTFNKRQLLTDSTGWLSSLDKTSRWLDLKVAFSLRFLYKNTTFTSMPTGGFVQVARSLCLFTCH